MLPASVRMRSPIDFGLTVRGVRAARPTVVVHARRLPASAVGSQPEDVPGDSTARPATGDRLVGFVVPKAVGGAVVRNRVKRRLRHLARTELARTPAGTQLVVRALPAAASAPRLAADLTSAWSRSLAKLAERVEAESAAAVGPSPESTRT